MNLTNTIKANSSSEALQTVIDSMEPLIKQIEEANKRLSQQYNKPEGNGRFAKKLKQLKQTLQEIKSGQAETHTQVVSSLKRYQ